MRYARDSPEPAPIGGLDKPAAWERPQTRPGTNAGIHRFVWALHVTPPVADSYDLPISAVYRDTPRVPEGPLVAPGDYQVRLTIDGATDTDSIHVAMDPRSHMTQAQLDDQYAMARRLASYMDRTHSAALVARNAKATDTADAPYAAWAKCAQLLGYHRRRRLARIHAGPEAFTLATAQAKSALLIH